MRFMVRGRVTGKTRTMVAWLRVCPDNVLLVHSEVEAARIRALYKIPPDSRQVMSWDKARQNLAGRRNVRIAVDNVDMLLQEYFRLPFPIDFVTATGEAV